ncbi:aminotransferase class V-fold PLP-dependent enzyme [Candidatus Gracilibacteria bacterium]|nr:aminotransferase class V-fold PLP-dependent enzyme [Candidatus Gracilibacteria bacterium]
MSDVLGKPTMVMRLAPQLWRARQAVLFAGLDYPSPAQAYAAAQGQIAYYRALEQLGHARVICSRAALEQHWRSWQAYDTAPTSAAPPLGVVISMESADPILRPDDMALWWAAGVRVIGPAHYGPGRYAGGTATEQGFTPEGVLLLDQMQQHGVVLDVTHLADVAFWQAIERFDGSLLASHNNCRAHVPHQRQFSDEQLRAIIARDGVIGVALDTWMLELAAKENGPTTLAHAVDHIDHICQLAGNSRHAAIGSDLDGGFGREYSPRDLDTAADLQRIGDLLVTRGYAVDDVAAIMHGNWLTVLRRGLPADDVGAVKRGNNLPQASPRKRSTSMSMYESLGVRRVINADARLTRLGGSLMPEPVRRAMDEAAHWYVDMFELQRAAGRRLAELTHNEAALVTGGAAAALYLATVACMLGDDPAAAQRLLDGQQHKREVIIHCAHRIPYDLAVAQTGARLVQIGNVLQTFSWELEAAINENTAAVLYIAGAHLERGALPLAETITIAHRAGVPVIVDAAAQLPPVENLWHFTRDLGADLALFSGGKDLCGPQASGLLVGKHSLIAACAAHAAPNQRLGRPMKVGKEETLGLLAAVERYLALDHGARVAHFERIVAYWLDALARVPGILARRDFPNEAGQPTPRLLISVDAAHPRLSAHSLRELLWQGDPRIAVGSAPNAITLTPDTLEPGEEGKFSIACGRSLRFSDVALVNCPSRAGNVKRDHMPYTDYQHTAGRTRMVARWPIGDTARAKKRACCGTIHKDLRSRVRGRFRREEPEDERHRRDRVRVDVSWPRQQRHLGDGEPVDDAGPEYRGFRPRSPLARPRPTRRAHQRRRTPRFLRMAGWRRAGKWRHPTGDPRLAGGSRSNRWDAAGGRRSPGASLRAGNRYRRRLRLRRRRRRRRRLKPKRRCDGRPSTPPFVYSASF